MRLSKPILLGLALLLGQLSASAADLAVLRSGASIPFLRKEQMGLQTRLYITGGYVDVPTAEIASFDKDDSPPPPAMSETMPAKLDAPPPATALPARTQVDLDQVVREASSRHQLDPDFVSSVIKAESNFKPHARLTQGRPGPDAAYAANRGPTGSEGPVRPAGQR